MVNTFPNMDMMTADFSKEEIGELRKQILDYVKSLHPTAPSRLEGIAMLAYAGSKSEVEASTGYLVLVVAVSYHSNHNCLSAHGFGIPIRTLQSIHAYCMSVNAMTVHNVACIM
jgi:hypothetical protein